MLLTFLACATPADSAGREDSGDTADTADTVLAPLSGEVTLELNPDNPLAAIATVTLSRRAAVHLEYGSGGTLDRASPSVEVAAGAPTRLQALGLTADTEWSVQVVADEEEWRSEGLGVQTEALDPGWACTPEFTVSEAEFDPDEVVCGAFAVGTENRYLCWDRWGTPRLSLQTIDNDLLLSMVPLPDGGWGGTSQSRSSVVLLDPFGAMVRDVGPDWLIGKTRYTHEWIDAHEFVPLSSGQWAGAVAVLTLASETAVDGQLMTGNGLVVLDLVNDTVLYDYSLLGSVGDGVSADERLPYTRAGSSSADDWTHANGLALGVDSEGREFVLMSLATQNWVVKLLPDTDELQWRLGHEGDFTLVDALGGGAARPATDWFYHQHHPTLVARSDGRTGLLIFDNGADRAESAGGEPTPGGNYSRVLEFVLDEEAGEAALPFEYGPTDRDDPEWFFSANRGSVRILPGDDRLLFLLGDPQEMREISYPGGEPRWSLSCDGSEPMQRVTWLESLYDAGWLDASAGSEEAPALRAWLGEATVGDGYAGTEAVVVWADGGVGAELCRVEYPVVSTGARADCADCLWAYDVVFGEPTVSVAEGCGAAGVEPAAFEGERRAYGLALDYLGHAHALMMDRGGAWTPVAFAEWDDTTGSFGYRWEQGTVE